MTDERRMNNGRSPGALAVLRIPEYRKLITGRFFYIMALRTVTTTVGWRIYEITHHAFAIGLVGLSEFLPAFCLALYAGHVIDKSDKRALLLITTGCYLVCVAGLISISLPSVMQNLGGHRIQWLIYGIIFCTGVIRAFAGPGLNAIIAQIVPREDLPRAITVNSSAFLFASILGHATAGLWIAHLTYIFSFSIVGVYALIAWYFFFSISPKPIMLAGSEKKTWESIKEGLRFVYRTREIMGAMALDLFAVLFGGAVAMVPVYARDILKVGAIGFGWLNAADDMGCVITIMALTFRPLRRRQGLTLMYVVAGFGVCIIAFGLSKIYLLSFLALLMSGLLDGVSVVIRGTILQLKTPDAMRGRVSSVNSMFINSSNELGQFESGMMARLLGVVPSVVFGGCMTLAVVIATWFKAPSLRKMEY
ncbi:MAG: MFS transporter [Bacteroidota bacterium]|nr:MFS transporter [Bacteroidota bacterium]MDP4246800.1 MFS transporter [Bacteroidota bacterium]MDP4254783.1 MFS transporter [Bacteroidota bacterium]MDP4259526.1 MFS transporter [Bacteroidota bacterium]